MQGASWTRKSWTRKPKSATPALTPPKLKVFISYARRDLDFADRLVTALESRDCEVLIDRRDLPLLEKWQDELLDFIHQADAVVFIVSPHAIDSKWCQWEVNQVAQLSKRLAPIVASPVNTATLPPAINAINLLFFDHPNDFEIQCDRLVELLKNNLRWIKDHTRIGERARRWDERGRTAGELLSSVELEEAETWLASRPSRAPEATPLQRLYIAAGRERAHRVRRAWFAGFLAAIVITSGLSVYALQQKREAQTNEGRAREESDTKLRTQSLFLADSSRQATDQRDAARGILLALEGLPHGGNVSDRPYVPEV
jgi:hypothetical protein